MKLTVNNLSYAYGRGPGRGGRQVLRGLSFSVDREEFLCIAGPNGSGKSTLVKCMAGLLDSDAPLDYKRYGRSEWARRAGYVPQSTGQIFSSTVFDTVLMGRKPHYGWRWGEEDLDITAETLGLLGLEDLALRDFNTLSGGQQQRVMIARALAQRPEVLFLDEPTSALDISHQLELMETLKELNRSRGVSIIMVIHDLNLAARFATKILMLKDGRIAALGSPSETLNPPTLESVFRVESGIHRFEGIISVTPLRRVGGAVSR